jgi:tryptophan-rich sensory protein
MQPFSKADRSMSHQRPTYGPPESAIAPIWLLFYELALGAAIAPRLVAGVTDPANR